MKSSRVSAAIIVTAALMMTPGLGVDAAMAAPPGPSELQLVSAAADGSPGDLTSHGGSASADGRYVAFSSLATRIGDVSTSGLVEQVYLRDIVAGTTQLISAAGSVPGNRDSRDPSISADGSRVAYSSSATNLVGAARSGIRQVLVWSRDAGSTFVASVSNDAVPVPANRPVSYLDIAADGRSVAFSTEATNLTTQDTRGVQQVFKRDLASGATSLVSVDPAMPSLGGESASYSPAISGDGRVVVFSSGSPLAGFPTGGRPQVYNRDTVSGLTQLASMNVDGTAGGDNFSGDPTVSSDGRFVAFCSTASDVTDEPFEPSEQAFVRDLQQGTTRLASRDVSGARASSGGCDAPSLSDDGRFLAFASAAVDLVPRGWQSKGIAQAYLIDLQTGTNSLMSDAGGNSAIGDQDSIEVSLSGDGGLIAFTSRATNLLPHVDSGVLQIIARNTEYAPRVDRIAGADRFAVSAAVSTDAFAARTPVVYVASGAVFADALSGSAAAGALHGPVLLVTKDAIPADIVTELQRLKPEKIVVLGGVNSIAPAVVAALAEYSPGVSRIAGADRYEVSAAVSAATFVAPVTGTGPTAYVASGEVFPDALSGSAAAGRFGGPVLLVQKGGVPAAIAAELGRLRPGKIVVLGGTATISESVVAALGRFGPTSRIAGADRFAVAAAVSADAFPGGARTVYVASGAVFPDALSGSAAAIQNDAPVLLITADSVPPMTAAELDRLDPIRIVVLGGTDTVSDAVMRLLDRYVKS